MNTLRSQLPSLARGFPVSSSETGTTPPELPSRITTAATIYYAGVSVEPVVMPCDSTDTVPPTPEPKPVSVEPYPYFDELSGSSQIPHTD